MIRRLLAKRRYMREHRWTHAHLSEYLDDGLPSGEAERVEAHVGICPHCRRVLATLRRTLEGLRSLGEERPPGVADAVIDRLRHEP
ncbi:MAG: anti-sigma factor family protein [Solirubrobacterales bacterium]